MKQLDRSNAREKMAKNAASVTQNNITIYEKNVNGKTNQKRKCRTSWQSLSFISKTECNFPKK